MLAIDFIRANRNEVERAVRDKGVHLDVDRLIRLDEINRLTQAWLNAVETVSNDLTRRIKTFFSKAPAGSFRYGGSDIDLRMRMSILDKIVDSLAAANPQLPSINRLSAHDKHAAMRVLTNERDCINNYLDVGSIWQNERVDELKKDVKELSPLASLLRKESKQRKQDLQEILLRVPNIPYSHAPVGPDETYNEVVRTEGALPHFDFEPLDHVALIEKNDWADLSRIVQVSGSRQYCLKGRLALLETKLMGWALERIAEAGFTPITVPSMAREQAFINQGQFPGHREETYEIPADELWLAGTAEVALTSLHSGEIIEGDKLPILYAGYSPCFRREAGSAGKDVRGLLRVHQFVKVEQYVICEADDAQSASWHARLLELAESMLQALEIPYQVIETSTGDMGLGKFRMNDIESWVPSLGKYRETHSCSTLHDWQARRANIRYRGSDGKVRFAHTLNNTALASPRILVPLLENHQTADGRVKLPKALQELIGGEYL